MYSASTLPQREFEVARATIAAVNDCTLCLRWRSGWDVPERAGEEVPEELYDHVIAG